ncbi:MAG: protein kinase, partial [Thermofilaceae archaeon]
MTEPQRAAARAKKRKVKKEKKAEEIPGLVLEQGIEFLPVKDGYKIVEEYWVTEPYAKVNIVEIPELGGQKA